jgi:hypothetical protein
VAEGSNTINKKDVTSITSALTFTYEEYLKLFVLIGTFTETKEKAMLTNVAKLMQVNLTKGMENVQKYNVKINKSENFDITQAFTMIKLKAEISIKTTFMNIPIPTATVDEYGNTKYELDFSKMGTGQRSIKYASVNGY